MCLPTPSQDTRSSNSIPNILLRVKGMTILLCVKGSFEVEVNMTPYTVTPGMLLVVGHDNIFRLKSADTDNLDVYMFVISPEFMQDINIDVAVLQTIRLTPNAVPILRARRGGRTDHTHIYGDDPHQHHFQHRAGLCKINLPLPYGRRGVSAHPGWDATGPRPTSR